MSRGFWGRISDKSQNPVAQCSNVRMLEERWGVLGGRGEKVGGLMLEC
jgi:hypothetical protein